VTEGKTETLGDQRKERGGSAPDIVTTSVEYSSRSERERVRNLKCHILKLREKGEAQKK